jgi:DNA glycosylase AlkZ-like
MDRRVLQGWWFERQGLMDPQAGSSSGEALAQTGWARSVGGMNPYMALFARAGISREQVDRDLAAQAVHELPSARGCTYVVPRCDYALALAVGPGDGDAADLAQAKKFLGVTEAELERLTAAVLAALAEDDLDPKQLKEATGDAVRNLGAEGKKRGMTTTLPLVLGRLQSQGRIRRVPTNGRLDQQRYRYARWEPSPLAGWTKSREEALVELAARYFRWIGPASLAHFQWFSGLGARAARETVAPLGLVPLEAGSDLLLFPEDREALQGYRPPDEPRYALVASIDGITHLRRDVASLLAEEDRDRAMQGERGLLNLGGVQDLSSHAILDRGRLIGLWEYDPGDGRIAWTRFVPKTPALEAAVARTEVYVRDQLGDARSFSLDSPESRRPRIEALRAA